MELNEQNFTSLITRVFKENGLGRHLSAEVAKKFFNLTKRMLRENEKYNLTAITEPEKIVLNHYADCAKLAEKLPNDAKIADIGCGAGFPTLPVAIIRPDVDITAIDSTAKRVNYVRETAEMLGLSNVNAITMRAEDGGKDPAYREKFDYAVARAVAEMRILTELCLPFVKVGGHMMAMKGKNAEFELSSAKKAISLLGGTGANAEEITLISQNENFTHPLIIIEKKSKTPAAYPRPYAQISKKPL